MTCDICGKTGETIPLTESYATKDIKDICYECEGIMSKKLVKIQTLVLGIQAHWMKRALKNMRELTR